MNNPIEIKKLAKQRLEEAEILFQNKKFDGAFYLAGYSVELMLKAKICERLGIPNIYDETVSQSENFRGIGELKKVLKTHNLLILLVVSGLKVSFEKIKAENRSFAKLNSLLFNGWDENARYKPCGYILEKDIAELIEVLSSENGLLSWIEKN